MDSYSSQFLLWFLGLMVVLAAPSVFSGVWTPQANLAQPWGALQAAVCRCGGGAEVFFQVGYLTCPSAKPLGMASVSDLSHEPL